MSTKNWELLTEHHKICWWVNQDKGVQGSFRDDRNVLHRIHLSKADAKSLGEMLLAASKESSDE